jgi:hypothetical protein
VDWLPKHLRDKLGAYQKMNIVRSATAIALLALFASAAAAQEKDKTTGTVKGKVRVERGSPGGVAVILRRGDDEVRRVETDRKGEFTIMRLAVGTYGVTFRKAGLAVGSMENIEVKAGKTRTLSNIVLPVDEGSIAFLRGSVFTEGGRSVPGARVELSRVISEFSVEKLDARNTGETGEFVFRVPPDAARYRLTLKADGAEPMSKDIDVDAALVYRVALIYKPKPKD